MITDREEAGELLAEPGPAASRRCLGPNCPTAGSETWACGEKWVLCLGRKAFPWGRKGQNHISENNTSKKSCISAMQCCFLQWCRNISPAASADHHLVVQYQTELTAKKMSFPQSSQPPESTQAEGMRGSSLQAHQQQQPPGLPGP